MLMISVTPFNEGWAVRAQGMDNAMVFASGAKAEAAARRLGGSIAAAGRPAEIEIWLRGGILAGRFLCPPATPHETPSRPPAPTRP